MDLPPDQRRLTRNHRRTMDRVITKSSTGWINRALTTGDVVRDLTAVAESGGAQVLYIAASEIAAQTSAYTLQTLSMISGVPIYDMLMVDQVGLSAVLNSKVQAKVEETITNAWGDSLRQRYLKNLNDGVGEAAALQNTSSYAERLAEAELRAAEQEAARSTMQHALGQDEFARKQEKVDKRGNVVEWGKPLRYMRVPNTKACGWCKVVADKLYTEDAFYDDMARMGGWHTYCRCTWTTIIDPADVPHLANRLTRGEWKEMIDERSEGYDSPYAPGSVPDSRVLVASQGRGFRNVTTDNILKELQTPDSGFTIDPVSGKWADTGIAVAMEGSDILIDAADAFDAEGNPTPEAIAAVEAVLAEHEDLFASGKAWLGGWHNPEDGMVEINVTFVFDKDHKDDAFDYARRQDQIAVADLDAISREDWDNAIITVGGRGGATRVRLSEVEPWGPGEQLDLFDAKEFDVPWDDDAWVERMLQNNPGFDPDETEIYFSDKWIRFDDCRDIRAAAWEKTGIQLELDGERVDEFAGADPVAHLGRPTEFEDSLADFSMSQLVAGYEYPDYLYRGSDYHPSLDLAVENGQIVMPLISTMNNEGHGWSPHSSTSRFSEEVLFRIKPGATGYEAEGFDMDQVRVRGLDEYQSLRENWDRILDDARTLDQIDRTDWDEPAREAWDRLVDAYRDAAGEIEAHIDTFHNTPTGDLGERPWLSFKNDRYPYTDEDWIDLQRQTRERVQWAVEEMREAIEDLNEGGVGEDIEIEGYNVWEYANNDAGYLYLSADDISERFNEPEAQGGWFSNIGGDSPPTEEMVWAGNVLDWGYGDGDAAREVITGGVFQIVGDEDDPYRDGRRLITLEQVAVFDPFLPGYTRDPQTGEINGVVDENGHWTPR